MHDDAGRGRRLIESLRLGPLRQPGRGDRSRQDVNRRTRRLRCGVVTGVLISCLDLHTINPLQFQYLSELRRQRSGCQSDGGSTDRDRIADSKLQIRTVLRSRPGGRCGQAGAGQPVHLEQQLSGFTEQLGVRGRLQPPTDRCDSVRVKPADPVDHRQMFRRLLSRSSAAEKDADAH